MAAGVVVDHPGDLQGVDERLDFRHFRLHMEDLDLGLSESHGAASAGGVEAFLASVNGGEFHAADRAATRFVALDPRVHGALIEDRLALTDFRCGGVG